VGTVVAALLAVALWWFPVAVEALEQQGEAGQDDEQDGAADDEPGDSS